MKMKDEDRDFHNVIRPSYNPQNKYFFESISVHPGYLSLLKESRKENCMKDIFNRLPIMHDDEYYYQYVRRVNQKHAEALQNQCRSTFVEYSTLSCDVGKLFCKNEKELILFLRSNIRLTNLVLAFAFFVNNVEEN